jgi:SAM-dependent methyltransferase
MCQVRHLSFKAQAFDRGPNQGSFMISDRQANFRDDPRSDLRLAPAPRTFFMTMRDIAFWIRSARADARLNGCLRDVGSAQAFDRLYESVRDPFGTELPQYRYQRRKYDSLLSMLPRRRYRQVLDIGCGRGAFTRKLAPFADRVIGADVSAEAVRQAQNLSAGFDNLNFVQLDVLDGCDEAPSFDLIILADILYYVDPLTDAQLKRITNTIASKLTPGGLILVVNHFFFGVDAASRRTREIHDSFRWAPILECIAEHRRPFFLATLLSRVQRS